LNNGLMQFVHDLFRQDRNLWYKSGLSWRLLIGVLVLSTVIALLGTGLQLYLDYRRDLGDVSDRIASVRLSHQESLTTSLWKLDNQQLATEMDNAVHLKDIIGVKIYADGQVAYQAGRPPASDEQFISQRFPLIYNDGRNKADLGELEIVASLSGIQQRLIDRLLVILATQSLNIFLVSAFILLFVQALISRHLLQIAEKAKQIHQGHADEFVSLDRPKNKSPDELDVVVSALNEMIRQSREWHTELEETVQERTESLSNAQRIAHLGNWSLDLTTNELTWSDEVYVIFGVDKKTAKLNYDIFLEMTFPEDREAVKKEYAGSIEEKRTYTIEHRIIRKRDGEIRWVHEKCEHTCNAAGEVIHSEGTVQDITVRKRTEGLAIRLGYIVEESLNEIFVFDAKTLKFTQVNYGARTNLGYSLEEMLELTPVDLKPEFTPDSFEDAIRPLRDGEKNIIVFRTIHKRKDGSHYDVEIHLQLMHKETPPVFVAIVQDISERKIVELALEKAKIDAETANKAKSEFLASMSHDLRTPLNAMMGFSEMMSLKTFGPLGDPHYEDYAKDIHQSGSHLISLIDDILDLSKVEAGKYVLNEEDLDIEPLIHRCVNMITTFADLKKLDLIIDIPPDLPRFRGDERAMMQVINNLLSNAVKFTPQDGHITVSAKVTDENAIEIIVADDGIGMSRHDITRALKPFEQADSAHAKRHEGTGLGLHLCQSLVKLHSGQLKVESEENQGTTFVVHLPPKRTVLI